eukprot:767632-Hanusia_phi.AAC.1
MELKVSLLLVLIPPFHASTPRAAPRQVAHAGAQACQHLHRHGLSFKYSEIISNFSLETLKLLSIRKGPIGHFCTSPPSRIHPVLPHVGGVRVH